MAKIIIEGTAGADSLFNDEENGSNIDGYEIYGLAGDDVIAGSIFDDVIDGGDGLDGVSYTNEMTDITVDLITGTAIGDSIGNDTLTNIEIVDSGNGNDTLIGNEYVGSYLRGYDGHDIITGGFGSDYIEGGAGNDDLRGSGNSSSIDVTNIDGDVIYGNDGNDYLTGSWGNDFLQGGQGSDVLDGGYGGIDDIASYSDQIFSVNVNLTSGKASGRSAGKDILYNIDSVDGSDQGDILIGSDQFNVLQGFGGNDLIKGLKGDDILRGNAGNDKLIGGVGDDLLIGDIGDDTITGGTGSDSFLFDTALTESGIDKIVDFKPINDTIQLDSVIFTQLTSGSLDPSNFANAIDAADDNDYIIYDRASGALSYDADGNGTDLAVQIAILGTHPNLTFEDFIVL